MDRGRNHGVVPGRAARRDGTLFPSRTPVSKSMAHLCPDVRQGLFIFKSREGQAAAFAHRSKGPSQQRTTIHSNVILVMAFTQESRARQYETVLLSLPQ